MVTSKVTKVRHKPGTEIRPYRLLRTLSDADRRRIIANNDRRQSGGGLYDGLPTL